MPDLEALADQLEGMNPDDLVALAERLRDHQASSPSAAGSPPVAEEGAGEEPAAAEATPPTVAAAPTNQEPTPEPAAAPSGASTVAHITELLGSLNLAGVPDQVAKVKDWLEQRFGIETPAP